MAIGDYILCCKCEVKLIYDGDRDQREWWEERFGKEPEIECPNCKPQRTWVGLTDEEKNDCLVSADPCEALAEPEARQLIEDVEQALKEKNCG